MDLLDLKAGDCRFPHGDALPYRFCGAPIVRGSYCAKHAALCLDPKLLKDVRGLVGMIYAMDHNVIQSTGGRRADGRGRYGAAQDGRVHPIDEVFATSQIGEKPLLERVL